MRKIAVFTGSRAEYGLLYQLLKLLEHSHDIELQLYVGGSHLSSEFGHTIDYIEQDGFNITETFNHFPLSDGAEDVSNSIASTLIRATAIIDKRKPELLVLLGDRYELLGLAQAALIAGVPIAHIHGGELTEGLIDEAIRHSVTKMSHLHFASTEVYKNRIIQLGEQPDRVFNVGAPGIDNIMSLNLLDYNTLSEAINFPLHKPYLVVTYHPVTLEEDGAAGSLLNLLSVLDDYQDLQLIISYPNADLFGHKLINILKAYQVKNNRRVLLIKSLGQLRYLSLMKYCEAVVGNSSSGLIEAPSFNVATVNIGNRQKGRLSAETVIHCTSSNDSIKNALDKALSMEFKDGCKQAINPYGNGNASVQIFEQLKNYPLENILFKHFYDQRVKQ